MRKPAWLHMTQLDSEQALEARAWQQAGLLHHGEAEAIALARQLRADWLLTDDAAERLVAQSLGLEVHGSLGVVLWAAAMRHLSHAEAESALDRLARSSLWISPSVLQAAKAALKQMAWIEFRAARLRSSFEFRVSHILTFRSQLLAVSYQRTSTTE
jgi:predicted nucleic acid-binding protein